jgi:hypothetical protein
MKTTYKIISLLLSLFILSSCEQDIVPQLETAEPQIVIDAWINNSPSPQYIRITETVPYFDSTSYSGIRNATVYIEDNADNTRYDFNEKSPGVYEWIPSTEHPQLGTIQNSYDLNVEIGEKIYTATSTLNRVPEVDSIVFSYKSETLYPDGYYAQFYATDLIGPGDTYWIKAYKNGQFLNKANEINLAFDAGFSAGSNIDGITFIGFIRELVNPYDSDDAGENMPPYMPGDSLVVEVHSINYEAFTFLNELRIQTDRPGGFAELFSVPLFNISTNIVSSDPEGSSPVGFFNMSSKSVLGEWLDPNNLPEGEMVR